MGADWLLVVAATLLASVISGIGGFGGGFIIVIVMTPIVGAKAVVPLLSVFAICGNLSRLVIYRRTIVYRRALEFTAASVPGVLLGAHFLAAVPDTVFLVFMGSVLMLAVPARRWLQRRAFSPGWRTMLGLGALFGFLSGSAAGSGLLVIAFFNSMGLSGPWLLGTDALIGFVNALLRTGTFASIGMLDDKLLGLGLMMGLLTWPGTWLASRVVARMGDKRHGTVIEAVILLGGALFVARALTDGLSPG